MDIIVFFVGLVVVAAALLFIQKSSRAKH